ncbi:2-hydroxychromene-2-carboxylate isomerase [Psychromonas marina]|uniref:2-hydroxychromene-2-carboxylate isomerase n=1 Tax=Psychromonas marina TaxID=88364 RepID=A0ABQ6DZU6_9GAMM|nr:DsbA family oxidoreductase [Psychromonas marina]GLS90504.1 2-hydroxychromene-2-carboxylate isomerase [Psychromonas marina]
MSNKIKLDIVSDVVCPWCVIGYKNLQKAIDELGVGDNIDLQWQPFELNPGMPVEGQDLREHVAEKYGSSLQESSAARINITQRGAEAGFTFNFFEGMTIVNTRDAHILLEYAHQFGLQTELKLRLFTAAFTDKKDVSNRETLLNEVALVGLDVDQAKVHLQDAQYRDEVVKQEQYWQSLGISAVPAVVFNRTSAMSGAQSVEAYKQALTELLAVK